MARRKSKPLRPWLTAHSDGRKELFSQVGESLLTSRYFQSLTAGAKITYICMTVHSSGRMEFSFPASAARQYGIAEKSLRRHVAELTVAGFLEVASGKTTRTPNEYRFTLKWKEGAAP